MSADANSPADRSGSLWLPFLISVAIALFLMTLMPTTMFWDRDEAFYARAAVEMLQSHNWILPTYNDAVFPDKPPLIYWLMAFFMKIFGENEFGARFASAPATAASAFLIFLIANRLFGRRAGLWSMLVFASSTLTIYLGITAMLDAVLVAFICLALWAFLAIMQDRDGFWGKAAVFLVAVSLAMLTKGPVGPAIIVPAVAITWLLSRSGERAPFWQMLVLAVATFVGVGIFLLWAVPANNMSNGEMLQTGIGEHVIGRALKPMQRHGAPGLLGYLAFLPAYIPTLIIGFMPATLFLPAALVGVSRRPTSAARPSPRLFLLSWMAPGFIMFSLAATKLPHYIEPMIPAFAIAAGGVIAGSLQGGISSLRIGRWLYILQIAGLAAALFAVVVLAPTLLLKIALVVIALGCIGFAFRISLLHRLGEFENAMRLALVSVVLLMESMFLLVIPVLEKDIKLSKPVAELLRKEFKPGTPVFDADYLEPSLVFYLGWPLESPIRDIPSDQAGRMAFLSAPGEHALVATREEYDALKALDHAGRLVELGSFTAWNTNVSGRLQTVLVARLKP
ncbi:4-amino-4-deoxy-L-arabinose transferase [Ensifer adhaerens]|nr:4-amino-4-deoxy-L-arabinose transferase [Ensifer adhaerens]